MDEMIYKELIWGIVTPESKMEYSGIINKLIGAGAEGVILGCTELTLFMPLNCNIKLSIPLKSILKML